MKPAPPYGRTAPETLSRAAQASSPKLFHALCLAVMCACCFFTAAPDAQGAPEETSPEETTRARGRELIMAQLFNDMMYGTDDYFGENRDLVYADYVVPSGRARTAEEEARTAPAAESGGGGGGDDDDEDDDDGGTSDGGDDIDVPDDDIPDEPDDPGG